MALPPPNRFLKHPTDNAGAAFGDGEGAEGWVRGGGTGMTPRYEDHSVNAAVSPSRAHKGRDRGTRRPHLVHSLGLASTYRCYENEDEPKASIVAHATNNTDSGAMREQIWVGPGQGTVASPPLTLTAVLCTRTRTEPKVGIVTRL